MSVKIFEVKEKFYFEVKPPDYKKRLDEFLLGQFPTTSKLYLREAIKNERCEVNGEWKNRGYLLKLNDFVEIEIEGESRNLIEPEPIRLDIVFEDADLLVINKAAEMLVHPTKRVRSGTLLNGLAHHLNVKNASADFIRAGLIHRLDKQTSGLMVIAKNSRAHRILAEHFQRRLVEKRYYALVSGRVEKDTGTIDAPIGRYAEEKVWNIKTDGKEAVTNFWTEEKRLNATLLRLEPVTGRTNQLRIHLAHIGHSIVGDFRYGGPAFLRLCLHAERLAFWHPNGGRWLEFTTALPQEFKDY